MPPTAVDWDQFEEVLASTIAGRDPAIEVRNVDDVRRGHG